MVFGIKLKSFILDNKDMSECNLEKDIKDLDELVRMAETTTILDQYTKNKINKSEALFRIYFSNSGKTSEHRK